MANGKVHMNRILVTGATGKVGSNFVRRILNEPAHEHTMIRALEDFLIDTGEYEDDVPHRPGRLYRFNYDKYEHNKRKWTGINF